MGCNCHKENCTTSHLFHLHFHSYTLYYSTTSTTITPVSFTSTSTSQLSSLSFITSLQINKHHAYTTTTILILIIIIHFSILIFPPSLHIHLPFPPPFPSSPPQLPPPAMVTHRDGHTRRGCVCTSPCREVWTPTNPFPQRSQSRSPSRPSSHITGQWWPPSSSLPPPSLFSCLLVYLFTFTGQWRPLVYRCTYT